MHKKSKYPSRKKIVLTGGHAGATAYAVVQELQKRKDNWDIFWIGSKRAFEGQKTSTLESIVFPKLGVTSHSIVSGRLQRKFTVWTVPSVLRIPLGFVHAVSLLRKIKPDIVLSFGGYSAFSIVIIAWFLKIPVVIHEQTSAVGRANRYCAFFSKIIALARGDSAKYFPREKCRVVGNPVSDEIVGVRAKKKISRVPTILVTGGQRGATAINDLIDQKLEDLLLEFKIIHQTGEYQYKKFVRRKKELSGKCQKRYQVYSLVEPWNWYRLVEAADIIVSRAGANIVSEIMVTKRPSILIPLPISYLKEQRKNAEFAEDFGIVSILRQRDLTPEKLLEEIYRVERNWNDMVGRVKNKKSSDIDADKRLVDIVEKTVK